MYEIVGRQTNGTKVEGYILLDLQTNQRMIKGKNEVYSLARNKQIKDVITQEYKGKFILKGTSGKISQLPNYDSNGNIISTQSTKPVRMALVNGRIMDGKNISGYKVAIMENGELVKEVCVDRSDLIRLASNGSIANVRHQKSNGEDILRGINCRLSDLPVIYSKSNA